MNKLNWVLHEKGVWTAYHKDRVYLLKSFEAPVRLVQARENVNRYLV